MVTTMAAVVGALGLAGLPAFQALELRQTQIPPYWQAPGGGQPQAPYYPYAPPASPYGGPLAYGVPPPYFGQPGAFPVAGLASPYGGSYMPPSAPEQLRAPSQVFAEAAAEPTVAAPASRSVPGATKEKDRSIQAFVESLLPAAPSKAPKSAPAAKPEFKAAKNVAKATANFIRNTVEWVNTTKHSENVTGRFVDLMQKVPRKSARMFEKLAIPVLGNTVVHELGLTAREKMLVNLGLVAAYGSAFSTEESNDTPLIGELLAKANHSATPDAPAPVRPKRTPYLERLITRWAARGEN